MVQDSLLKQKSYLEPQRDDSPLVKLKKTPHINFLKIEPLEVQYLF